MKSSYKEFTIEPERKLTTKDWLFLAGGLMLLAIGGYYKYQEWEVNDFIAKAAKGDIQALGKYLRKGKDVNAKNSNGETALMKAAHEGKLDTVEFLLQHRAAANASDKEGATVLMYAISGSVICEGTKLLSLLLDHGADINSKTNTGETPLIWAAQVPYYFVKGPPEKNAIGKELAQELTEEETQEKDVLEEYYLGIVKFLVEKGANTRSRDKFAYTAYDKAVSFHCHKIAAYLQERDPSCGPPMLW